MGMASDDRTASGHPHRPAQFLLRHRTVGHPRLPVGLLTFAGSERILYGSDWPSRPAPPCPTSTPDSKNTSPTTPSAPRSAPRSSTATPPPCFPRLAKETATLPSSPEPGARRPGRDQRPRRPGAVHFRRPRPRLSGSRTAEGIVLPEQGVHRDEYTPVTVIKRGVGALCEPTPGQGPLFGDHRSRCTEWVVLYRSSAPVLVSERGA